MIMRKLILSIVAVVIIGSPPVHAQEVVEGQPMNAFFILPESYTTAVVENVTPGDNGAQNVQFKILGGDEKNKIVSVTYGDIYSLRDDQKVAEGDNIVVTKAGNGDTEEYQVLDKYRLPGVMLIALLFFVVVVGFGRKKDLPLLLDSFLRLSCWLDLSSPASSAATIRSL